jgi:hypothetical protein
MVGAQERSVGRKVNVERLGEPAVGGEEHSVWREHAHAVVEPIRNEYSTIRPHCDPGRKIQLARS